MDFVNQTAVPARLEVSSFMEQPRRFARITAKATFQWSSAGATLDTQEPCALVDTDTDTELGILPSDFLHAPGPGAPLEVIVLGCAYAPTDVPVPHRRVALNVGRYRRELEVFGDREWVRVDGDFVAGAPRPFTRMPLTWERAFGGSCEIEIDRDAFIEISDPVNRRGRGFNAEALAVAHGRALRCPEGYPRHRYAPSLPNLEDSDALLRNRDERPRPICWATVPFDCHIHMMAAIAGKRDQGLDAAGLANAGLLRAHPDLLLPASEEAIEVVLDGLAPGDPQRFRVPRLRVLADCSVDGRVVVRELVPRRLVVLAEERRFYVVYRDMFHFDRMPRGERSARLRLEQPSDPGAKRA